MRRVGDVQILMAGYHAPDGAHEEFVPLQIASEVLGDVPSGRLYKALVETGLASQIGVESLQQRDPGMVIFFAMVPEDSSLDAARAAMIATIDGLATTPITAEEVERIRNQAMSGFEQAMNNSQSVAIQLSNWAAIGDWRLMFLDRDRVRTATRRGDAERRAEVFQALEPHRRHVHARRARPRGDSGAARRRRRCCKATKATKSRAEGEAFDPTPANIESRITRVDLPGGIKLVMLPKETRGDAVNAADPAELRRREQLARAGPSRGHHDADADARHAQQVAPRHPGRARAAAEPAQRRRRRGPRFGEHPEHAREPARGARARDRGAARARVPGVRARRR